MFRKEGKKFQLSQQKETWLEGDTSLLVRTGITFQKSQSAIIDNTHGLALQICSFRLRFFTLYALQAKRAHIFTFC